MDDNFAGSAKNSSPSAFPSARSRRDELLEALLARAADESHERILCAYQDTGTVAGAEDEFCKIIQEIIDEA